MNKINSFLLILILIVATSLIYSSGLHILIHEGGHSLICKIQGGVVTNFYSGIWSGKVTCSSPEWNKLQKFMFYSGGVGAELIVATFFLLCPYLSIVGGTMYVAIAFYLYSGAYNHDLELLVEEVSPKFSLLLQKDIQVTLLILGGCILTLSLYYSYIKLKND